jgi:hypothetical protein
LKLSTLQESTQQSLEELERYLSVRNANDVDALSVDALISNRVLRRSARTRMPTPVEFEGQTELCAVKVHDVASNHDLTSKFQSEAAPISQAGPSQPLGCRRVSSHRTGECAFDWIDARVASDAATSHAMTSATMRGRLRARRQGAACIS